MTYNFDQIIDRKNTNSIKYDFAKERNMPDGILPLWVADMDFKTPIEVTNALVDASVHGIFGYSEVKEDYFKVLESWFLSHYQWKIERQWLIKTPGVVYAIATAIKAFTQKGEGVMIQKPVYYPFSESILENERILVNNPLVYKDTCYTIDLKDFEDKIKKYNVKLFLLCNPHNPVGRVWTKKELTAMGDICVKHKVLIVSDEIHMDFIYPTYTHQVFSNLKKEYGQITITCTAPSKTFNLAGLQVSNVFIENPDLKKRFKQEIVKSGYSQLNTMGLIACKAAYEHGDPWLSSLKSYLNENLNFVREYLSLKLPMIKLVEPQGTYLVWLDFTSLSLSVAELEDLIIKKANLWLDGGTMFGEEGANFQRINIACQKSTLEKAFNQLKEALDSILE